MVLEEIVLHNVGVFQGKQRCNLAPPSPKKPVVLIGGMNGAGKTTLLESLQLALYGRFSNAGRLSGLSYEEYLRRLINRNTSPRDGAAVEIRFAVREDGVRKVYQVRRSWRQGGKRVRENVEVAVNGVWDSTIAETWHERVGRFIPQQMSHLFFFDGDRIESLADPSQSADLMRTAIDALLGVDLVDLLSTDLKALQRRIAKGATAGPAKEKIEEAEESVKNLEQQMEDLALHKGELQNTIDQANRRLDQVLKAFKQQGGELSERHDELRHTRNRLQQDLQDCGVELRRLAASDLPLFLTEDLLQDALNEAMREQSADLDERFADAFEKKITRVLARLAGFDLAPDVLATIEGELRDAASDRPKTDAISNVFRLSAATAARLQMLVESALTAEQDRARVLVDRYRNCQGELEQIERLLAAVPDRDSLAAIVAERNELERQISESMTALDACEDRKTQLETSLIRQTQIRDSLLTKAREAEVASSDVNRILDHSEKARAVLTNFRRRVTARHAKQLEDSILDCFRQLLRKNALVNSLTIDPTTCAVTLRDAEDCEITPERLSMGERQLLAVAMLWGMARASGRPLPVIVDTPLGRLDSNHRTHLVQRYFPHASHQVILLSTDEEIDPRFFERMKSKIGQTWRLEFDDKDGGSKIVPGYFFEHDPLQPQLELAE